MRDNCASLVPILQLSHGSCLTAGEGQLDSHSAGSLGYCCWHLCLRQPGSLGVWMQSPFLGPCPQPTVKGWVDWWLTVLWEPGYPARVTQPWICASAGYVELIKL